MPCFKFEVTINFDAEGDDPSKNDITQFITRMIKLQTKYDNFRVVAKQSHNIYRGKSDGS